jgi:transcriptional regulator with PAS, ATPase and Fis domain
VVTTEDRTRTPALVIRPEPRLHLVYSGDAAILPPRVRPLRRGAQSIGRDEAAAISLVADTRSSRHHATLHVGPATTRIVDETSRNGTFVDGQRVRECVLRDGAVVAIGDSFAVFRDVPDPGSDAVVDGLEGAGPGMRAVRAAIAALAPERATVLVLAETGCGKELVARGLHGRRAGAFVAVNCAAIPESLAEAQLFGQVAGAFTGAIARPGVFAGADGGTLFLDEIGELPAALQPKLLRALLERVVTPVGATHAVACDVRVIAATNRDLRADVERGTFRADLFARLDEAELRIPPLRERREDLVALLIHFLGAGARLSPALAEAILLHAYPFNVRELQAIASQLRLRGRGAAVLDLPLVAERLAPVASEADPEPEPRDTERPPDRARLEQLLRDHHGVVADVARAMDRSRKQVYRWIAQHGLDPKTFR